MNKIAKHQQSTLNKTVYKLLPWNNQDWSKEMVSRHPPFEYLRKISLNDSIAQ
jgi:hypothetical protein